MTLQERKKSYLHLLENKMLLKKDIAVVSLVKEKSNSEKVITSYKLKAFKL
jgi:hypothetical protein